MRITLKLGPRPSPLRQRRGCCSIILRLGPPSVQVGKSKASDGESGREIKRKRDGESGKTTPLSKRRRVEKRGESDGKGGVVAGGKIENSSMVKMEEEIKGVRMEEGEEQMKMNEAPEGIKEEAVKDGRVVKIEEDIGAAGKTAADEETIVKVEEREHRSAMSADDADANVKREGSEEASSKTGLVGGKDSVKTEPADSEVLTKTEPADSTVFVKSEPSDEVVIKRESASREVSIELEPTDDDESIKTEKSELPEEHMVEIKLEEETEDDAGMIMHEERVAAGFEERVTVRAEGTLLEYERAILDMDDEQDDLEIEVEVDAAFGSDRKNLVGCT